jgi:glutathione S-transferase
MHLPVEVQTINGDQIQQEFIENSPFRKVPVLVDDGFTMFESRAQARYLVHRFPDQKPRLIPSDLHQQAKMDQWCSVEAHFWTPEITKLIFQRVWGPKFRNIPSDETVIEEQIEKLKPIHQILNSQLGQTTYLAGNDLSLADVFYAPSMQHLSTFPEKAALIDAYPNIARWWSAVSQTSAWQQVVKQAAAGVEETRKGFFALRQVPAPVITSK